MHEEVKIAYLLISKVTNYFLKKRQGDRNMVNCSLEDIPTDINITDKYFDCPLWENFDEPTVFEVGNVISLTCGHAARPSETEAINIHSHLIEGGFI